MALSCVVLFTSSSLLGIGTSAALSGTSDNTGNSFSAGTVSLTDNDSGGALFSFTNARPGVVDVSCLQVTYTGSLTAGVRVYSTVSGALAPYVKVTVTRGTEAVPTFDTCAGFVADTTNYSGLGAGVLFSGTLSAYPASWGAGIVDPDAAWATGSKVSYKFTVELLDTNAAQGLAAGATFTWEARS